VRTFARLALAVVSLAGLGFAAAYLYIAAHRLSYPFDLEWMEGACADHVARILAGHPIYARPTFTFIPFFYPPFYYYASAAAASIFGLSLATLRAVSFVSSLALFGVVARLIRHESGSHMAAILGVGLFAATYRVGGAWLDLARVDSLFLALTLLGVYVLRAGRTPAGAIAAGVVLALAALTKQTAALVAVPLLAYATFVRRRDGLLAGAAFAAVFGVATFILNANSGGWYLQYILFLPAKLQSLDDVPPAIWRQHLFGPIALLWVVALATISVLAFVSRERAAFLAALLVAFVGAAWASGRHSGAWDDVFIPAHLAVCLVAAIGVGRLAMSQDARAPAALALACGLCLFQLSRLTYSIEAQIPSARDVQRARELRHEVVAIGGPVFVPDHGFLSTAASGSTTAHAWAMFDLLRLSSPDDQQRLVHDVHAAFEGRRFAAVIVDKPEPWFERELNEFYRRDHPAIRDDALWMKTGYATRPRWVYVPR
jgi:hypothetical protein